MGSWLSAAISIQLGVAVAAAQTSTTDRAVTRTGLPAALEQLTRAGKFSGAVVVRGSAGVRFARGYGLADPFAGRRFTPETRVDSGSLAKPVTAAAVLALARDGALELDAPLRQYLPEYPYAATTVRHLLAHSAGLPVEPMLGPITGKTNAMFLAEMERRKLAPLFAPGSGFAYCNFCYTTLALLIERISGKPYLQFVRERIALPAAVTIRPAGLAEWKGRAIGYRRGKDSKIERADSFENELFYGSGNLSISAGQLARWGAEWWQPRLANIKDVATTPATIAGKASGLSWGSWYCAPGGKRCHYLGHHEGFHHMLYWDSERKISVAMVTNNSVDPALHQRLQRALVSFADGSGAAPEQELSHPLPDNAVFPGTYKFATGETVTVLPDGDHFGIIRGGITYRAFQVGARIRYVPGLDVYLAGAEGGGLHWLGLYADMVGVRTHG